jgi:hypothetical protein
VRVPNGVIGCGTSSTRWIRRLRSRTGSMPISASRISPVRGSTWRGPMPPNTGRAVTIQRIDACRASTVSQSASSGWIFACTAPLKPMRSKALFHSRTPAITVGRYLSGMLRSSQKTIGRFGSDSGAAGSFFSRRQRSM